MARVHGIFRINHVGIVIDISARHAYNILLTKEREVMLLEPSTDEYWFLKDHKFYYPYNMAKGYILL